ncbi:MAG: macro domain-containing protein, partial [Pirellulaceae bacterium]|nr:macro domain-containing protein [Pirellulaceae bacterium]
HQKQARFKLLEGDLFNSDCQTITNATNCVGVMGKGIALEFKRRFPEMYADYIRRFRDKELRLGEPYVYKSATGHWILNFPTKNHWRQRSKLSDIQSGLDFLASHIEEWGICSIAIPPLGCGLGGLEWPTVLAEIYARLRYTGIRIDIFQPIGE